MNQKEVLSEQEKGIPEYDISVTLVNSSNTANEAILFDVTSNSIDPNGDMGLGMERCQWLNIETGDVSQDYSELLSYLNGKRLVVKSTTVFSEIKNAYSEVFQRAIKVKCGAETQLIIPLKDPFAENAYTAETDQIYLLDNTDEKRTCFQIMVPANEKIFISLQIDKNNNAI